MIISAQEVCRTRLCRAVDCTEEAENYQRLCFRCAKKDAVRIHEITQPAPYDPNTQLCCSSCHAPKPDDAFSKCAGHTHRRGRRHMCRACCLNHRRNYRANLTPEKKAAQDARQRARKQAARDAKRAQTGWPPA